MIRVCVYIVGQSFTLTFLCGIIQNQLIHLKLCRVNNVPPLCVSMFICIFLINHILISLHQLLYLSHTNALVNYLRKVSRLGVVHLIKPITFYLDAGCDGMLTCLQLIFIM